MFYLIRRTLSLIMLLFIGAMVGYVMFDLHIDNLKASDEKAEAIVVLTGAADRIPDALRVLSAERGKRLLITGVNISTRSQELITQSPEHHNQFQCCVDIGKEALNTEGNAVETRKWQEKHRFKSLVVVTNDYHMPRSLLELSQEMPKVKLIPHPVKGGLVRSPEGEPDQSIFRHRLSEYIKYVAAQVRINLFDGKWPDMLENLRSRQP